VARFPGFSAAAQKFFRDLRKNNTREWFQPRKEIFEREVKGPMVQLVGEVNLALASVAPAYVTEPAQAIYRIYRDTRFSPDKTPYKTHIAAHFNRQGVEKHVHAGFYFSVSDQSIEVAAGIYMPDAPALLAIRHHLMEHHARFRKLTSGPKLVKLLGPLKGDALSRPPKGFPAEHPAIDLIKMKQWMHYEEFDGAWMTSPTLVKEVTSRFAAVAPVVDFLNEPLRARGQRPSAAEMLY
jgi:uncharacterized protein (TIGR02453 family)